MRKAILVILATVFASITLLVAPVALVVLLVIGLITGSECDPTDRTVITTDERVNAIRVGPLFDEWLSDLPGRRAEQIRNAEIIYDVGIGRGELLADITTALAVAMQESDLINIAGGDRDSLGLFQQRPSQGWGTPEEIMDPVYAANAYYNAQQRIDNRVGKDMIDVAMEVQRPNRQLYIQRWNQYNWDDIAIEIVSEAGSTPEVDGEPKQVVSEVEPLCREVQIPDNWMLVNTALDQVGEPYTWDDGDSFTGAAFVHWVHQENEVSIPEDIQGQFNRGSKLESDELVEGDLVFWSSPDDPETPTRVAVYVGNNNGTDNVVAAVEPEALLRVEPLDLENFLGGVRTISDPAPAEPIGNVSENWTLPINPGSYRVSSPYGMRLHPILGQYLLHNGIDLSAPLGTPVRAASSGTVTYIRRADVSVGNINSHWNTGLYVVISHGGGVESGYGHLMSVASDLKVGDTVDMGDVIGHVGSTGNSTGPHLHFVIVQDAGVVNGKRVFTPVSPSEFFSAKSLSF